MRRAAAALAWGCLAMMAATCARESTAARKIELTVVGSQQTNLLQAVVDQFNASLTDVHASFELSSGSPDSVQRIQDGTAAIGFAQADAIYEAYKSVAGPSTPRLNLRAMAYNGTVRVFFVVRTDSPYGSVSGLRHKIIGLQREGTNGARYARMILLAYGIGSEDAELRTDSTPALIQALEGRSIDAAVFVRFGLNEIEPIARGGFRVLEITGGVVGLLQDRFPFVTPADIQAESVGGRELDVRTVGVDSFLICREDLDEQLVYALTRNFFIAVDDLSRRVQTRPTLDPARPPASPIPVHPGAARFYRERQILH